jgi:hypothetical protein
MPDESTSSDLELLQRSIDALNASANVYSGCLASAMSLWTLF